MRKLVRDATLRAFNGKNCDKDAIGYMCADDWHVVLNSKYKMSRYLMRTTLMHEALHSTVERRGRKCNPCLSTETEHIAMALLGDPDEFNEIKRWRKKKV